MAVAAAAVVAGAAVLLFAVLAAAQRALLRRAPPRPDGPPPPVSVLRPLCGADPALAANLETLFRQDHPDFEVLLGAADPDDPALGIARRVAAAHPHVRSSVIADARRVGTNPKVDTLANLLRRARHGTIVVSDSNVALPPGHLRELCLHLGAPGVGVVSSPIVARPAGSLGSALEGLQLNTYVMGGAAGLTLWLGGVCCIGKTMAFTRRSLDAIGGIVPLGRHLAEDQVCGEAMVAAGLRATMTSTPVENVLGPLSYRAFCARHLRWARIRRWMSPAGYAAEVLMNPFAAAATLFALAPAPTAAALAAALFAARAALDAAAERRLGVARPLAHYLPLLLLKEATFLALHPVPFFSRTVTWRGRRYELGPRTLVREITEREITGRELTTSGDPPRVVQRAPQTCRTTSDAAYRTFGADAYLSAAER